MPEISTSNVKVADSARTAQPTVLEVPVTIQGSKPVEGQEKREIFTETTKTTLVFGNGAVVNLASRLLAGQCVFLRNENSGREILCKVLESRPAGPTNYTDLEFTAHDPNFWDARPVQSVPPAQPVQTGEETPSSDSSEQKSDAQKKIDAAVASLSSTAMMESSTPTSEDFPAAVPAEEDSEPEHAASVPSVAPPERAPEQAAGIAHEEVNQPEPNDAADAEHLAALIAMDGKPKPNRESPAASTKQTPDAAAAPSAQQDSTSSTAPTKTTSISTLELRLRTLPFVAALKNPIGIGIAASLLIAATVGIAWHVKRGSSARSNATRPSAASTPPKQQAQPAIAQNSSAPTPTHAAASEQIPAKDSEKAPAVISVKASIPGSNEAIVAKPRHRKANEASSQDIVPAKILSQSQPGIPSWAQGIETDGIVQLDALIDEKGNVKETRPLSGPRALQKEAERVVALWVFEPAMAGGKPTATHMVLTVQFQM